MSTCPNRWLGVFTLCVISLGFGCSGSSEHDRDQDTAAVAVKATKIVYYAIPG